MKTIRPNVQHPTPPSAMSPGPKGNTKHPRRELAATRRARSATQPQPSDFMKTSIHLHADLRLDEDLADVWGTFAGSPVHRIGFDFDGSTGLDTLAELYPYRIYRGYRSVEEGKLQWNRIVLRFARDAFAIGYGSGTGRIVAATAAKAEAILEELTGVLAAEPEGKEPCFYVLRYDGSDFIADAIDNLPQALDDEFLRLAYGDDVSAWVSSFTTRTRERQSGLTVLEGPPGTGKTSLVSEMIRRLHDTHLFYVLPVCNDGSLTAPELVSFWQGQHRQHPNRIKVVVMEDAERVLLGRNAATRDAVAAVLNIADGLLGRMLRLHLVCSINARFEDLDPAIQRPGRLMNYRRFGLIPRERAAALSAKQGSAFVPHPEVDEFTLAEVLQPGSARPTTVRRQIGFGTAK